MDKSGAAKPTLPTSSARIADMIRADIASGVFAPGMRLRIGEIAERYGTSHLPVREALRVVEGNRLIEMLPNRGTTVRAIDERYVNDLWDVRTVMEEYLINRAAERASDEEIVLMRRRHEAFIDATKEGDISKMVQANRALHDALYSPAGNEEALHVLDSGWELVVSLRRRFGYTPGRQRQICEEHEQIVNAMEHQNGPVAALLVRQHCESARNALIEKMRSQEEKND